MRMTFVKQFQVPDTEIEGAVVEQTSNWDTVQ